MSLAKLTSRHEAMILRMVEGATQKDICQEFDMDQSRLSVIASSSIWKKREQELRLEAKDVAMRRLETLRNKAIDAIEACVDNTYDDKLRLMSAKEILSRTGISETSRIEAEIKPTINLYMPKSWATKQIEDEEEQDA